MRAIVIHAEKDLSIEEGEVTPPVGAKRRCA
jgi:hypothetical protein